MLNVSITRNGVPFRPAKGWGYFHLNRICDTIETESYTPEDLDKAFEYATAPDWNGKRRNLPTDLTVGDLLRKYRMNNELPYVIQSLHIFSDPTDGEIFYLIPGDELNFWG